LRNAESHVPLKSSIHANRLKLYRDPRDFRNRETPQSQNNDNNHLPQADNNNDGQDNQQQRIRDQNRVPDEPPRAHQWHVVKKLLKSKWKNNKRYYLVQWEDGSEPTWEPSNDISQFLKQLFHGSRKRRKRIT
jgi:hypothetical protein